jgi:hypothetical protein
MDSQHFEGCLLANDIELCGITYALEATYEGWLACICNLTCGEPLHTWMPAPVVKQRLGLLPMTLLVALS